MTTTFTKRKKNEIMRIILDYTSFRKSYRPLRCSNREYYISRDYAYEYRMFIRTPVEDDWYFTIDVKIDF